MPKGGYTTSNIEVESSERHVLIITGTGGNIVDISPSCDNEGRARSSYAHCLQALMWCSATSSETKDRSR